MTNENQIQIPDELWSVLNKKFTQAVVNNYFHDKQLASITLYGEVDLFVSDLSGYGDLWDYDSDKFDPCSLTFFASDFNVDLSNITDWRLSLTKRPEGL